MRRIFVLLLAAAIAVSATASDIGTQPALAAEGAGTSCHLASSAEAAAAASDIGTQPAPSEAWEPARAAAPAAAGSMLLRPRAIEVAGKPAAPSGVTDGRLNYSQAYESDWDRYSSNYIYNQLSNKYKKVWDGFDAACRTLLEKKKNAASVSGRDGSVNYVTSFVSIGSMNPLVEGTMIAWLFRACNPQYYFLNTNCMYTTQGGKSTMALILYPSFGKGAARAKATAAVKAQAASWVAKANALPTEEEKLRVLHDAVVDKVDYNYSFANLTDEQAYALEKKMYTQSAYSVFCMDETVCAGYALALAMVLNGAGVDAFSVTSTDHQWVKVRVNDSWYNVDPTWADQGSGRPTRYTYYARSDAFYDSEGGSSHVEEAAWWPYLPSCTLDSGSTTWEAGKIPQVSEQVAPPEIELSRDGGAYQASMSCATPGATIYYTTDGSAPGQAFTRSKVYREPFRVKGGVKVRAVAVCDARIDSEESTVLAPAIPSYTVVFKGNGSTGGSMKSQTFTYGSGKALRANAFKRKGYKFAGWNTKKNGKGVAISGGADGSTLSKKDGATVKLYAQWKKKK